MIELKALVGIKLGFLVGDIFEINYYNRDKISK